MFIGLYRVNYDEKNWQMLSDYLKTKHNVLPELNRVLLIDNAMELAWTGKLKYDIAFDLLSYIKDDIHYLPWDAALSKLGSVVNMLKRTASYGLIQVNINFNTHSSQYFIEAIMIIVIHKRTSTSNIQSTG